jgi:hypothetical protein
MNMTRREHDALHHDQMHDGPLFVAFVASIKLRITIKSNDVEKSKVEEMDAY